ncbi:bifunctional folylpolyglutamate synthase/dihydrofolate synthase [Ferdinandcohnia quinoae]|uniref:Dihydrofolate synthase/folylpolyglutamate synthase n=1 Tax=Fredinandcohnia quinoae TaxID=2918902 RepID=A0AAW5EAY3_9BACI|nr:folylpolyglutamate synthase/dihydrofolate synthase family protein [Fredinandcohnia sp. SECRCQ15]MCH1626591.1 bifunctional folylpolyglutamate synthase/dihydrofolate synthase [Fredinandcohnia sp. SECRCQ15]
MVNSYEEALEWIHSRLRLGMKPGLKRMEWMMERLNHPEKKIKAIHIAGTNGKGSTVSYLRNIFQESGYNVGTFTSPYIETFNERISFNGEPIKDEEIVTLLNIIKPLAEELEDTELGGPTEFEVITAMALYYFATNESIDFVIMEVGLGGRLDSTNVIRPIVSIITNIGFDHMDILGDTISEISFEKAGIIKKAVPVITSVEQEDAIQVIQNKAKQCSSELYLANFDYFTTHHESSSHGEIFTIKTPFHTFEKVNITMKGFHQVKNASLALMTVSLLVFQGIIKMNETKIMKGIEKTKWIGRFEQLSSKPEVIIDGAHNPQGIKSLVDTVGTHLTGKEIHIIFSPLKDKKLDNMISQLENIAASLTFTSFDYPRASTTKDLYELSSKKDYIHMKDNWKDAVDSKINELSQKENVVLLITGSLYFISEIRPYIIKNKLHK